MPRYYFNLYDDIVLLDEEGLALDNDDAAREQAIKSARSMACQEIEDGKLTLDHRLEVVDEDNRLVLTLHFRDAFEVID